MKSTRQYTCTRRMNKNGDKIWVVLENGKLYYRIFKTQTDAITYFKKLQTPAQMLVQQATSDKFSKIVFTLEEMARKGYKNPSKTVPPTVVKDSDKFFDEKELKEKAKKEKELKEKALKEKELKEKEKELKKKAKSKPVAKSKPATKSKPVAKSKPIEKPVTVEKPKPTKTKKSSKPKPTISEVYIEKIVRVDANTGEIITDEEFENLLKTKSSLDNKNHSTKTLNLISELEKLDELRVEEFEKTNTLNFSIIDEILKRKSLVEDSWYEELNELDDEKIEGIENTIYIKEEIEKPIIINSTKINFNEESHKETSTIENIIDQRIEETNIKSVDYGRIKEYTDYEKTQIQNFQNESSKNIEDSLQNSKKNSYSSNESSLAKAPSNAKFWTVTVLMSLFIMLFVALIILWFLQPIIPIK